MAYIAILVFIFCCLFIWWLNGSYSSGPIPREGIDKIQIKRRIDKYYGLCGWGYEYKEVTTRAYYEEYKINAAERSLIYFASWST